MLFIPQGVAHVFIVARSYYTQIIGPECTYSLLNFGKYLRRLEASGCVELRSAKPRIIDHKNRSELPKELKGSPTP